VRVVWCRDVVGSCGLSLVLREDGWSVERLVAVGLDDMVLRMLEAGV